MVLKIPLVKKPQEFSSLELETQQPVRAFKFYAVKLSLVIVIVFVLQLVVNGFSDLFVLNSGSWFEPWRFLTSIFLHANLLHIVLNLFALLFFGSVLEKFIGGKGFLLVFFSTGILANLIAVNFYSSSLGASGAIFGIIGALVFIRPGMPVWAFGLPMPMVVAGIVWAGADIIGTYGFFVGNPMDNTGNIAHLSGMFFGFVFGYFYRRKLGKTVKKMNVSIDENEIRKWEDIYLR
jgi:membrane associated rhomboid family serine protease